MVKIGRLLFNYRGIIGAIAFVLLFVIAKPKLVVLAYSTIPIIIGLGLRLWAKGYIGNQSSKAYPVKLVTAGPYHFVRNPLYTGNFFLTTGVLVASGLPVALILAGIVLFAIEYYLIIKAEEALLTAAFPSEYPIYRKQTGMVFPKTLTLSRGWSKGFSYKKLLAEIKTAPLVGIVYLLLGLKTRL